MVAAVTASLAGELRHLGTLKFNTRLQDAADESVFDELPVLVTIQDVTADSNDCQISYRLHIERPDGNRDEQRRLVLADVDEVTVEPFESYQNESEGAAGWVYTLTEPQVSAVVIAAQHATRYWFAVPGTAAAKHLAEDIKRAAGYCHGQVRQ